MYLKALCKVFLLHEFLARINSVQTRCIVKGEARKSPLFGRFSGGLWFSQDRLFSRNSTRKPLNLTKAPIFTNTPCTSTLVFTMHLGCALLTEKAQSLRHITIPVADPFLGSCREILSPFIYTEQMDAEGLGCKLLLTPQVTPREPHEKQTVGTVAASHHMLTLQALSGSLNAGTAKRGCLGRGKAFGWPPALCPPKRPRPFTHYRNLAPSFKKSQTEVEGSKRTFLRIAIVLPTLFGWVSRSENFWSTCLYQPATQAMQSGEVIRPSITSKNSRTWF